MPDILFYIWAWTFFGLWVLHCLEGWNDDSHWDNATLRTHVILSLLPLVAQWVLGTSLWEYGKYGVSYLTYQYRQWKSR